MTKLKLTITANEDTPNDSLVLELQTETMGSFELKNFGWTDDISVNELKKIKYRCNELANELCTKLDTSELG